MRVKFVFLTIFSFMCFSCSSTNEPNKPVAHQTRFIVGHIEFDSLSTEPRKIIDFPDIDTNISKNGIYGIWVEVDKINENSIIIVKIMNKDQVLIYQMNAPKKQIGHYYNFPNLRIAASASPFSFFAFHSKSGSKDSLITSRVIDFNLD